MKRAFQRKILLRVVVRVAALWPLRYLELPLGGRDYYSRIEGNKPIDICVSLEVRPNAILALTHVVQITKTHLSSRPRYIMSSSKKGLSYILRYVHLYYSVSQNWIYRSFFHSATTIRRYSTRYNNKDIQYKLARLVPLPICYHPQFPIIFPS